LRTIGLAIFHGYPKKVAFMLKVERKTEYMRIEARIELLERDVQAFCSSISQAIRTEVNGDVKPTLAFGYDTSSCPLSFRLFQ
jgi:hypothetical protein